MRENKYLRKRGERWHYYRRVPSQFGELDNRGTIRVALGTSSFEEACLKRDELAEADEKYWSALAIAHSTTQSDTRNNSEIAKQRYSAAKAYAMAAGFKYTPLDRLVDEGKVEDIVERVIALKRSAGTVPEINALQAEALLGTAPTPKVKISKALDIYFEEIAIDDQLNKSENQRYQWRKVKMLSINYFVELVGDIPLADIDRDHALKFHRWWLARMTTPANGEKPISPSTANRHIGNMRLLYSEYFKHIGDEERQNPFRNLFFKSKMKAEVPAFQNDWVRQRVLKPGALLDLKWELQLITYMLIETGCRPSEIINLQPEDFQLNEEIPYISIRPQKNREIKTGSSIRNIPLVGVALEAAQLAPNGFPHYYDKNELFSANMLKAFRVRKLFPTQEHVIYSFRHAFEKRMQEANIDYGLRCLLMGHQTDRPAYGDGGGMAYRRDELLKIAHPFSAEIFLQILEKYPELAS